MRSIDFSSCNVVIYLFKSTAMSLCDVQTIIKFCLNAKPQTVELLVTDQCQVDAASNVNEHNTLIYLLVTGSFCLNISYDLIVQFTIPHRLSKYWVGYILSLSTTGSFLCQTEEQQKILDVKFE
jgi:hypothetical protein